MIVVRRLLTAAGVLLFALGGMGVKAEAAGTAALPAPLFSTEREQQTAASLLSQPWGDPLDLMAGGDGYVTRGELAIRLADILGLERSQADHFTDVESNDEWYEAVGALCEAGLLNDAASTDFSPDQTISREQALAWIVDAVGYKLGQADDHAVPFRLSYFEPVEQWLGAFHDRGLVSPDFVRGVANAYRLGIVDPSADGYLYPTLPLSAGDMDRMLGRAFLRTLGGFFNAGSARSVPTTSVSAKSDYGGLELESRGPAVWYIEHRLASLRYRPGPIDGIFDVRTRDAVLAFQKVEGLERDGAVGESLWKRLAVAETPKPRLSGPGVRVEADLSRQVLFLIKDDRVWKVVHISSGASKSATLTGHFEVDHKMEGWTAASVGPIYYTVFFSLKYKLAIHGTPFVPTYPASHGCLRVPVWMAKELSDELPMGTSVDIYY